MSQNPGDTQPLVGGCRVQRSAIVMLGVFIFKQEPHIFILLWAPQMMQRVLVDRLCVVE